MARPKESIKERIAKIPLNMDKISKLYLAGWTDKQVADFLGITKMTIERWKKDNQFLLPLKDWKNEADEKVERSLYERATGYEHDSEEIFCFQGEVIRVPIKKKYAPSEVACIFWLKNRHPERWREKAPEEKDERLEDQLEFTKSKSNQESRLEKFYN